MRPRVGSCCSCCSLPQLLWLSMGALQPTLLAACRAMIAGSCVQIVLDTVRPSWPCPSKMPNSTPSWPASFSWTHQASWFSLTLPPGDAPAWVKTLYVSFSPPTCRHVCTRVSAAHMHRGPSSPWAHRDAAHAIIQAAAAAADDAQKLCDGEPWRGGGLRRDHTAVFGCWIASSAWQKHACLVHLATGRCRQQQLRRCRCRRRRCGWSAAAAAPPCWRPARRCRSAGVHAPACQVESAAWRRGSFLRRLAVDCTRVAPQTRVTS